MGATGTPGKHLIDSNRVVFLTPFTDDGKLFFRWGPDSQTSLHTHSDCLGAKMAPAPDVSVFFPLYGREPAHGPTVTGTLTLDVSGTKLVEFMTWDVHVRSKSITDGSVTIANGFLEPPGASQAFNGVLVTCQSPSQRGFVDDDIVRFSFGALSLETEDERVIYEHGDPMVAIKVVSNPPSDPSHYPTCPPQT